MAKDKNKKPFTVLSKKGLTTLALASVMTASPIMLAGCGGDPGEKGDVGANGKSAYDLAVENGFTGTEAEWLASLKGSSGKDIVDITSRYHYDESTGKKYYIYTFHYSDGTTEEEAMEIRPEVMSISYTGQTTFNIEDITNAPELRVNVVYDDLTQEEIVVTDSMYVVDGTYVKPNFSELGTYNVKISYHGITTTAVINVVDYSAMNEYTVKTSPYKNLQKFSHWEDGEGNVVSTDSSYTYMHMEEQNYIAVYEDFLEMTGPRFSTMGDSWIEGSNKYSSNANGWLNMAYVTEAMKQNMFIEFEIKAKNAINLGFGISERSYLEAYNADPAHNGWLTNSTSQNLNYLYVSEFNMYAGMSGATREPFAYLRKCEDLEDIDNGNFKFESPSIDFNAVITAKVNANANLNIKFVLADRVMVYIENQLFSATNLPTYTIADNKDYFFTFFGNNTEMTIKDFGYLDELVNRGLHESMTSNPVTKASFSGKKITFIGDSITYGHGVSSDVRYTTVLSNSMGMVENNMGISGTVYCTGGHRQSRIDDAYKVSYDSDYVSVLLGVNDFDQCKNQSGATYYSLGEFGTKDTSTIYGAVDAMCSRLVERFRFTDTKIFLMTPVVTSWNNSVSGGSNWDQSKENVWGYTLRDLCDAIEKVAKYYGIATLDLNEECEMLPGDFSDGIHPNANGMAKMAATIEQWLINNFSY